VLLHAADLEQLFTKTKQMEGIDDNIYWSKRPPWKRPRYNRTKKAYIITRKLKSAVWTVSKWQKDYKKPGELVLILLFYSEEAVW
jgi:hypothetical protein